MTANRMFATIALLAALTLAGCEADVLQPAPDRAATPTDTPDASEAAGQQVGLLHLAVAADDVLRGSKALEITGTVTPDMQARMDFLDELELSKEFLTEYSVEQFDVPTTGDQGSAPRLELTRKADAETFILTREEYGKQLNDNPVDFFAAYFDAMEQVTGRTDVRKHLD